MKKTVIYTRVSSTTQVEQGHSLENQLDRLTKYCELHKLKNIVKLTDSGISGTTIKNRPSFCKLIEMVKKNEVDTVVVYSLSRFGRNTIEVLQTIDLLTKNNVAFHSLTEKVDTTNSAGKFFLTVLSALAEMESNLISERISSVLATRKANGFATGRCPFGKNKNKDGKLVDNPEELKTLKIMHDLRDKGMSIPMICKELTKQKRKNKAGRVVWNVCSTHRYLNNKGNTVFEPVKA